MTQLSSLPFFQFQRPLKSLSSSTPLSYRHGSESPECNRNKALSALIRLFLFLSTLPSWADPYHFGMFCCAPSLIELWLFWVSSLKVIWSLYPSWLYTYGSHIVSLSLVIRTWDLLAGTPPSSLPFCAQILMETGAKENKANWAGEMLGESEREGKGEIKRKRKEAKVPWCLLSGHWN